MTQHLPNDGGLGAHIATDIIEQTTGVSMHITEPAEQEPETPLPHIHATIRAMASCPICEEGSPDFDFIQDRRVGIVGAMVRCENDCFGERQGSAPTSDGSPVALTPYHLALIIEALVRWWGDMCAALVADPVAVQRVRQILKEQPVPAQVGPASEQLPEAPTRPAVSKDFTTQDQE